MKIVFLHGLGQRAADWDQVASQFPNTDCPELFEIAGEKLNYSAILSSLEERYEYEKSPYASAACLWAVCWRWIMPSAMVTRWPLWFCWEPETGHLGY